MHTKTCHNAECARKFRTARKHQKFCSTRCKGTDNRNNIRTGAGRKSKAELAEIARRNQPPRPPAIYDNHKTFPYYIARL